MQDEIVGKASEDIPERYDAFRLPSGFSVLSKLVMNDLNQNKKTKTFYKYTMEDIQGFLKNPQRNEKQLRNAVIYLYSASPHFRRIIQYFAGLSDLSYVISPHRVDISKQKTKSMRNNYLKTRDLLANMDIKNQFPQILTVCWREDVFYGTFISASDSITVQRLPSDYCSISVIEGNVYNVTFDFSYFDQNSMFLPYYPPEFQAKYDLYKSDVTQMRYQELDSPSSFAIKLNTDIPDYAVPPMVGILREIFDIEDYKGLKLTRTELENYAILVMKLGMTDDGEYIMPYNKAKDFWFNLDSVLPEEVGSVLTPMPIEKIGFDRSGVGDTDAVAEAEQRLFGAAGISSLLFNNEKASANALLLSIKVDQSETFRLVKSIEQVINRYIQSQKFGKNFRITFLDVSAFNRKEAGDEYLKACQYGIPMVSYYCASQGMTQADMEGLAFLENEMMGIKEKFIPLQSSATQSANSDREAGAPDKDIGELTEAGEQTREMQ